jgi:RNA polymerase sigma-70 factor (ECF subfamily)
MARDPSTHRADPGGKDKFEAIVRTLEPSLGRFVAQMIREPAVGEDVLQETFYIAWRERDRMPENPDERRAWMYGIARNQSLHALRKGRRGRRATESMAANVAVAVTAEDEAIAMRDLLSRLLKPEDRSLFVLRYVHGFSAEALAQMTGLRPATLRKRLERSAAVLRQSMAPTPARVEALSEAPTL